MKSLAFFIQNIIGTYNPIGQYAPKARVGRKKYDNHEICPFIFKHFISLFIMLPKPSVTHCATDVNSPLTAVRVS